MEPSIEEYSVTAVIVGGNTSGAAKVVTGTVENLKELIEKELTLALKVQLCQSLYKTALP